MPLVEQLLFEELPGIFKRGRITGAHLAEELDQCRFGNGLLTGNVPFGLLLESGSDEQALRVVVHILKQRQQSLHRCRS